jgi:ectoine hydroxylase-related dioxygenase (phytanoyl-CoA dioxygenase family)
VAAALTAHELARFDELGYLVVPNALEPAHVVRLQRAFANAVEQVEGTQHVRLDAETPELAAWQALEQQPSLTSVALHVLGGPWTSNLHGRNPLPGFGEQGLHADSRPRVRGEAWSVVTALWMLDDFTSENGATRIVPGSHRLLGAVPKPLAQPGAHHPHELVVSGLAGSVLIINGHLWHSGRRNRSSRPRRAAQHVLTRRAPHTADRFDRS